MIGPRLADRCATEQWGIEAVEWQDVGLGMDTGYLSPHMVWPKTNLGVSVAQKKVTSNPNHLLRLSGQNKSLRQSISARFKSLTAEWDLDNFFKEDSSFNTEVNVSLCLMWSWHEVVLGSSLLLNVCDAENWIKSHFFLGSWFLLCYKPQVHRVLWVSPLIHVSLTLPTLFWS